MLFGISAAGGFDEDLGCKVTPFWRESDNFTPSCGFPPSAAPPPLPLHVSLHAVFSEFAHSKFFHVPSSPVPHRSSPHFSRLFWTSRRVKHCLVTSSSLSPRASAEGWVTHKSNSGTLVAGVMLELAVSHPAGADARTALCSPHRKKKKSQYHQLSSAKKRRRRRRGGVEEI